jgi:hypothetical protein
MAGELESFRGSDWIFLTEQEFVAKLRDLVAPERHLFEVEPVLLSIFSLFRRHV